MIDILMDKDAIDVMSTLIAKMESITFDDGRTCIFRTTWGKSLFLECTRRMLGPSSDPFDLDEWFRSHVRADRKHSGQKVRRDIDPSLYQQSIETDWLSALLELELKFVSAGCCRGSLLRVLHNILEMEDSSMTKLAKYCKAEMQYNFEGLSRPGSSSAAYTKLLMPVPMPPPKPGSIEDMLKRK
jgi:hypothetical protein